MQSMSYGSLPSGHESKAEPPRPRYYFESMNVAVEMILLRILEILVLNLASGTGQHYWKVSWFWSVLPVRYLKLDPDACVHAIYS